MTDLNRTRPSSGLWSGIESSEEPDEDSVSNNARGSWTLTPGRYPSEIVDTEPAQLRGNRRANRCRSGLDREASRLEFCFEHFKLHCAGLLVCVLHTV